MRGLNFVKIKMARKANRLKSTRHVLLGLIAAVSLFGCSSPEEVAENIKADLVLMGGKVYTMNWATRPRLSPVDAVAIKDGLIVSVGNFSDLQSLITDSTELIDVGGATILPGLVDSHTHVPELGASLSKVNLVDVKSEAEAVEIISARASQVPAGEWIIGQGWDEGAWANHYPDLTLISEKIPNHPVFMRSLHGFAGWANQQALDSADINKNTIVPSGGEIGRFANGNPNGLFLNRAVKLLDDAIPEQSRQEVKSQILTGLTQMARDGYVTVHDAGLDSDLMQALIELETENKLPIRVYAMLSARDAPLMKVWLKKGPDTDKDSMLVTRSVKAYYDGALGSRGAKMLDDYSDAPGHRGVSGGEYGFDQALVTRMMASGFQVGVHAIGDAGNRETLDFFQRVFEEYPQARMGRHRIEHAQILHPDDLPRLSELNIIASMEPPHAVEDKTWAEDRVGKERIRGAYAWRSLKVSGATVIFNSDNPGSDHSIFYGLHSAITRQDKHSQPEGGWYPNEAFTIDEALHAYTSLPAYAAFREQETGILAPGRWADITVIDIDPFELASSNPAKILGGKVLMTIVSGRIVYRSLD